MASDTPAAMPDLLLKFEGELTPAQLAEIRAQWEVVTRTLRSEYERGRAEEREACARLAEQSGAFYVCYSHVEDDNGVTRLGKPHPFADVIRNQS